MQPSDLVEAERGMKYGVKVEAYSSYDRLLTALKASASDERMDILDTVLYPSSSSSLTSQPTLGLSILILSFLVLEFISIHFYRSRCFRCKVLRFFPDFRQEK